MANKDGIISIGFDYKKELEKMIREFESEMDSVSNNTNLSKGMKTQFDNIAAEMRKFKSDMEQELSNLGSGKVSQSSFKSFKQNVENKFKGIREDIDRLDLAVSTLNSSVDILGKGVDLSKFSNEFKEAEDYVNRTHSAIESLIDTLGEQGISLFSFDSRNIVEFQDVVKQIDKALKSLDTDIGSKFELFDEEQAQSELNRLSTQLVSTLELMENAKNQMTSMDSSANGFKKVRADFASFQLQAATLNETIETLYETTESKGIYIEMDDKSLSMYEKYTDDLSDNLESIISYAETAKKELSSLLVKQKAPSVKVSSEMNPSSAEFAGTITIETTSSELWKILSPIMDDLQKTLNSNPVVAPVKLVVAPTAVSAKETGNLDTSLNYSKKYQKVLAETSEDAVIDLEGVYKKTFTSIMDETVSYAKETIAKIQNVFESSPIKLHFDFNEEEFKTLSNALLSGESDKKLDITGEVSKAKKEVDNLVTSLGKVEEILSSTDNKKVSFKGFDKFAEDITKSLSALTELQTMLKALQNIEITFAKAFGISSVTEIESQWENVSKLITNAVKLDGTFRKNANVNKLASEYSKYLDMGGSNKLSDIGKIKDNEEVISSILSKVKELNSQKVDTNSVDKADEELKSVSSTLDDVISRLNHMINLTRDIGKTFYKMFKDASISDVDKQWSSIENKFSSIADESGKINLAKQKKDIQELMEKYQKYVDAGGMKSPFNLTDNTETIKKLNKVYEQLNISKKESSSVSKESKDFDTVKKSVDNLTSAINTKTEAIKTEENTMELAAIAEVKSIQKIIDALNPLIEKIQNIPELKIPKESDIVDSDKSNISSGNGIVEQQLKEYEKLQDEIKETIALTDRYGEVIEVYRGTRGLIGNGNVSNRYHGGTFWTSSKDLATQAYADENKITRANLFMKNPYLIQGGGSEWDELYLSVKQCEELEAHINNLYASINDLFSNIKNISGIEADHLFESFNGKLNFTDFENEILEPINSLDEFRSHFEKIDYNSSKIPQVQNYISELYNLFLSFSRLTELSDKGALNTNEITEIAKSLSYDGVVFSQIYDGISEPSDVFVTFEEEQSKVLGIISAAQLKLEEQQRLAELYIDTREDFYKTLKTFSKEQLDEYIDKSAFNFVTDGAYNENLAKVLSNADVTEPIDNIRDKIREYINSIIKEFGNLELPIKDVFQNEKVEQATTSAKELDKTLEQVNIPTDSFDDVLSKLDLAKSELKDIVKITKQSISDSEGKFHDSYTLKDSRGSTEIYGLSSNTEKGQLLRSNIVQYDSKSSKEYKQQELEVEKQITEEIKKQDIEQKKKWNSFQKENTEENKKAYQELTDTIQQYSEVSKRIANGKVLEGDIELAQKLEDKISNLQKQDILSSTQIEASERKLEKLFNQLDVIEKKQDDISKQKTIFGFNDNDLTSLQAKVDKLTNPQEGSHYFEYYANQVTELSSKLNRLQEIAKIPIDTVTQDEIKEAQELKKNIDGLYSSLSSVKQSQRGWTDVSATNLAEKFNQALEDNPRLSRVARNEIQALYHELINGNPSRPLGEMKNRLNEIIQSEREAGRAGKNWLDIFKDKKIYGFLGQMASMFSFYDLINVGKQGFEIIKEYDTALTEMNKVSSESISILKDFQKESFDLADAVGTTASQIQNSAADFLRLGESFEQAKLSAQDANALFKVAEFSDISEATDALVAMSQAYDELEKSEINDIVNYTGNNFSISTAELASALQRSAATLKVAGNDIYEATALVTAGNAVLQDAESVGTGLKMISLRILGTEEAKNELASLGEDVDDFVVQTKSKLDETIRDYTAVSSNAFKGISVLDENGNYRSTYEILRDISLVYQEILEADKKAGTNRGQALLEVLAGKNRSNVAASILQNPELLTSVYEETISKSQGSVEKELEAQLQSIESHMNELSNAWDKLWVNDKNREVINFFLDLGKGILDVVDDVGVLNTAIMGIGAFAGIKNIGRPKMFGLVLKYADNHKCSLGY